MDLVENFDATESCIGGKVHRCCTRGTVLYNEWELKRIRLVEAFASTCTLALEHSFIHPLLKHLDLFDDYTKQYVGEATKL